MAPSAITPSVGVEDLEESKTKILEFNQKLNNLSTIQPSPSASMSDLSSTSDTDNSHEDTTTTPQTPISTSSSPSPDTMIHDLICIGFGPASLAIAIALHDRTDPNSISTSNPLSNLQQPSTLYLEKQPQFAWHSGMQLPGAKMQISFLKDLATPRLPTSKFTFLNYLHSVGRLDHFINLSTFLPRRKEYEDYLRWCASFFEQRGEVRYGCEVQSVQPNEKDSSGKVTSWLITSIGADGELCNHCARNVVVAVGGKAVIPSTLQGLDLKENVFHSSEYAYRIQEISQLKNKSQGRGLRFAVIGAGQSAAEIFNDLWDRFPEAEVRLVIKGASLRPSDDSPFVNEIFNPTATAAIYALPPSQRHAAIALNRPTNYGVVRLELLEHLYEKMYTQRLDHPASPEREWRCQILPNRSIISATKLASGDSSSRVLLRLGPSSSLVDGTSISKNWDAIAELNGDRDGEELEVDYIFTATGYIRDVHEDILSQLSSLLPISTEGGNENGGESKRKFEVTRDYQVLFDHEKVDTRRAGIWLQGCNEETHGLSDTLLSVLAVRGGEVVESIFGKDRDMVA